MISAILALERSQGIGYNNSLPWPHLKEDLSWLKNKTLDNIVIMGANTWESIKKPLPGRINVVLSRNKNYAYQNGADHSFSNPDTAIVFCQNEYPDKEIYIVGGSAIYEYYMPVINKFYITEIDADFACDRFFNLGYVQKQFPKVVERARFDSPFKFTIKEYSK